MKSWRGVHRWSEEDDEVEKKGAIRLECAAESVAASSCRLRDALIIATLCRLPPRDMSPVGQTPEASRRMEASVSHSQLPLQLQYVLCCCADGRLAYLFVLFLLYRSL
jgi:hypothetical protein